MKTGNDSPHRTMGLKSAQPNKGRGDSGTGSGSGERQLHKRDKAPTRSLLMSLGSASPWYPRTEELFTRRELYCICGRFVKIRKGRDDKSLLVTFTPHFFRASRFNVG